MAGQFITEDDLQYLASESSNSLNMIIAGMTSLMEENFNKVSMIENQNWFQRMSNTISGKNKMTQQDIERNHDKINLYLSQALGELYSRECIDHEIVLGLGNKINELYESQLEIKQIIGAFAQKLNKKIESIDNFHMVIEEINQSLYRNENPFVSISKIMSQIDLRTVQDKRKMEILVRAMSEQKIIEDKEIQLSEMLEELLSINESEAGVLALFFGNMRNDYVAEIAEDTIFAYYSLPEKIRKMKNKHSIVESILKEEDIDLEYAVSSREMCETLIDAYANNVIAAAIEEEKNEEEEKRIFIAEYVDDSLRLLYLLRDMVDSWEAKNGEMNTSQSRKEYAEFMCNLIDNLDTNSFIGNSIITSLNNLTFFAQKIFSEYENLRLSSIPDGRILALPEEVREELEDEMDDDSDHKVNKNVAVEVQICGTLEYKFSTVSEYFSGYIHDLFFNPSTRLDFSLQKLNAISAKFPDPSGYDSLGMFYSADILMYVFLFEQIFGIILYEMDHLDDNEFIEEVFNLCKKYPVEYNDEYNDIFIRKVDIEDSPHVELEYKSMFGIMEKSIGYASLHLTDYETKTVIVRFVNVAKEEYSVRFEEIENSYTNFSGASGKYVDIEWGEEIEDSTFELKITKNNSEILGSFKLKVYVNGDENIVAYIH